MITMDILDQYDAMTYAADGSLLEHAVPSLPTSNKEVEALQARFIGAMLSGSGTGVYVIYNPATRLTKIGITGNLSERKRNIETACGSELEVLLWLLPEPGYDESAHYIEATLHAILKEKRARGEWFRLGVRDIIQLRNVFYRIGGADMIEHSCWSDSAERARLVSWAN